MFSIYFSNSNIHFFIHLGHCLHGRDQQRVHHPRAQAEEGRQREEPEPQQVCHLLLRPMLQCIHHNGSTLQRNPLFTFSGSLLYYLLNIITNKYIYHLLLSGKMESTSYCYHKLTIH